MSNQVKLAEQYVFTDILIFLQQYWIVITLASMLGLAAGLGIALMLKPVYRATVQVMPATAEHSTGGLAALSRQFGDLASLAGIDVSLPAGNAKENVAILKIKVGPGVPISSVITKEAVEDLELKKGKRVLTVIKSTEIQIGKEGIF